MKNLFTFLIAATALTGCRKCYTCNSTEQRRVQGEAPQPPITATYELCDITSAQLRYHTAAESATLTTVQNGQTIFVDRAVKCE